MVGWAPQHRAFSRYIARSSARLSVLPAANRGCSAAAIGQSVGGPSDPRDAVVKIFNTRQRPGWTVPWQDQPVESSTGSGAVISFPIGKQHGSARRRMVLTAAHVVSDARYLQVQRSTDRFGGEKFRAKVSAICHEADIALLSVEESTALDEIHSLEVASAEQLPRVFDKVRVVGYPFSGDACSITEGVVSRVEVQEYSHSLRAGLALTVDAAINSGNSGGPLVDVETGAIVGVAHQKLVGRGVELQGHAVPAPLIQRFLKEACRLGAGPVTEEPLRLRLPSLGCDYQSLEPRSLRQALRLGDRTGILVGRLHHAGDGTPAPAMRQGDVLLEFNGHSLDEIGFCSLLGRRLHFAAARDLCTAGERVPIKVWRDGQEMDFEHTLIPARYLVPRGQYDVRSSFFMCGGLVFQPLSHEYLQGWTANDRPPHLQNLFLRGHLQPERTEAVMISQILADDINAGYDSGWIGAPIVQSVNGQSVRNLAHMIGLVDQAMQDDTGFLSFQVQMSSGPFLIAVPIQGLSEANVRISGLYGLPPSCSEHEV